MLGGRGAGKTRAGAEWVRMQAELPTEEGGCRHFALIGETYGAARAVMVDALEAGAAVVLLTPQLPPLEVAPTQLAAETSLH